MADECESIERELIRTGALGDFETVSTNVEPTAAGDDSPVRITLQMPEGEVVCFAFALVYVLGLLSFHDGRPRGYSGKFFDDDVRVESRRHASPAGVPWGPALLRR